MDSRIAALTLIRDQYHNEGRVAAICRARAAFDAGQIDPLDVPEVFIALKTGSWRFLDQLLRGSDLPVLHLANIVG